MVEGSPAWNPQATFALLTMPSRASSSPRRQTPKPSPRSAFRSIRRPGLVTGAVSHRPDRLGDTVTRRLVDRSPCRRPDSSAGLAGVGVRDADGLGLRRSTLAQVHGE